MGLTFSQSLIFGGASLSGEGGGYGFGSLSEIEAEKLIKSAWDIGLTQYDTAPIYGYGLSEERLGRYLPKSAKICTKGGVDWHPNRRVNMTNSPLVIDRMLSESLKRLGRDFIDLYMIHWPDPSTDIRLALEPVISWQKKGFIGHIGLANTHLEDLNKAQQVTSIHSVQIEGSYLAPDKALSLLPNIGNTMMSQSWGTLSKGILTGRVTMDRKFDQHDLRSWAPWWKKQNTQDLISKAQPFLNIANQFEVSPMNLAIRYNLRYLKFNQVLIGFKSPSDLLELQQLESHKNILSEALNALTLQNPESTL